MHVRVTTLALDSRAQPVVILKPVGEPVGEGRLLPIWIGVQEATAIVIALEATEAPPRPMSYDLMARLLESCGARVESVEVSRIEEGTFYATITLATPAGRVEVDARPSDSIALAVRVGAPLFVAQDVMDAAGIPDESASEPADDEAQVAAFTDFLDRVDPEDFRG